MNCGRPADGPGDRGGTAIEVNRACEVGRTGYGATRLSQVGGGPTRQVYCTTCDGQTLQAGVDGQVSTIDRGKPADDPGDRGSTAVEIRRARDVGRTDDCPICLSQSSRGPTRQGDYTTRDSKALQPGVCRQISTIDRGKPADDPSDRGDTAVEVNRARDVGRTDDCPI